MKKMLENIILLKIKIYDSSLQAYNETFLLNEQLLESNMIKYII